jgi:hypothetical protein
MEGGWDSPRNRERTLRERNGNDETLAEGNDDDDKYNEDGNIPDESALPAESIPRSRPESQRTSVPSR